VPFLATQQPGHRPHFGFTRHHGFAVHAVTLDHLKPAAGDSGWARFNKRCAIWLTKNVGSMNAFWLFTAASAVVAPSCLYAAGYIHWKNLITTFGFELLATLILSTWLELALMPAIMVGQNIQNAAADARAAKEFEDIEDVKSNMSLAVDRLAAVLDRLDLTTEGGLKDVADRIDLLRQAVQ
jgi:hypothetical protein